MWWSIANFSWFSDAHLYNRRKEGLALPPAPKKGFGYSGGHAETPRVAILFRSPL
jgi:hypothetical protein